MVYLPPFETWVVFELLLSLFELGLGDLLSLVFELKEREQRAESNRKALSFSHATLEGFWSIMDAQWQTKFFETTYLNVPRVANENSRAYWVKAFENLLLVLEIICFVEFYVHTMLQNM